MIETVFEAARFCHRHNWNQGKAHSAEATCAAYFAIVIIGIKAKLLRPRGRVMGYFAIVIIGIKAKLGQLLGGLYGILPSS